MKKLTINLIFIFLLVACKKQEILEVPDRLSIESLQRLIERSIEIKKVSIYDEKKGQKPVLLIETIKEKPSFESKYIMVVGGKKIDMKRFCQFQAEIASNNPDIIDWMDITLSDCNMNRKPE